MGYMLFISDSPLGRKHRERVLLLNTSGFTLSIPYKGSIPGVSSPKGGINTNNVCVYTYIYTHMHIQCTYSTFILVCVYCINTSEVINLETMVGKLSYWLKLKPFNNAGKPLELVMASRTNQILGMYLHTCVLYSMCVLCVLYVCILCTVCVYFVYCMCVLCVLYVCNADCPTWQPQKIGTPIV